MEPAVKDHRIENPTDHRQEESDVNNYWDKLVTWFDHNDGGKWLEDMRGMLSLVSTMIATMTFQVALNPPGGVLQAGDDQTYGQLRNCTSNSSNQNAHPCAGGAVLAIIYSDDYILFQTYSIVSFMASLSVTLLLVSGNPLLNKVVIWILSIGMIITLTFVALTFLQGIFLIHPGFEASWVSFKTIYRASIYTWIGLVGIVALFLTIRFLVWVVKNIIEEYKSKRLVRIIGKISANIRCLVKIA